MSRVQSVPHLAVGPARVAYQGVPGAFSELALRQYFGARTTTLPCPTFYEVFDALRRRTAMSAVVAVENSIGGAVGEVWDLLRSFNAPIAGEISLRVSHCLLGLPGSRLGEIRQVYSHPQAVAQCRGTLARMGISPQLEMDTAGSALRILREGDHSRGALAHAGVARQYGLKILARGLEDSPRNFTRFLVLGQGGRTSARHWKTTVLLSAKHQPGSLYRLLEPFAKHGIQLTRLESRPQVGKVWEYDFFLDLLGHAERDPLLAALHEVADRASRLRVLGSYPSATGLK